MFTAVVTHKECQKKKIRQFQYSEFNILLAKKNGKQHIICKLVLTLVLIRVAVLCVEYFFTIEGSTNNYLYTICNAVSKLSL